MANIRTKSVVQEYLLSLTVDETLAVLASLRYRHEKVTSHKRGASYAEQTEHLINVIERALNNG